MRKKWSKSLLSILLIVSNVGIPMMQSSMIYTANAQEVEEGSEWELVFSDEFDGTEINMDNWSFDHPENGRYNGEIQSYTDQNAWVKDGNLIIEARKEQVTEPNGDTFDYTSSKLITQGKQKWTYGKFEIRAKMPTGQGMWPAIWMMPEDEPFYGTWPVGGEIDIMEMLGHEPDRVHGNIHYGDPKGESPGTYILDNGESFADDYHLYTLEWEPGEIRWYIDGELYNTANDWHSKAPGNADEFAYPAPFDQDFFLILNISVGGGWPGNPDETTPLPQQMAVDYVRVYQKDEYPVREKPEPSEEDLYGREPLEDGNYVYNGNFNSNDSEVPGIEGVANTDYWSFGTDGGAANLSVDNEMLHLDISNGGSVEHGVQLLQAPIRLEQGATYKASFKAKAESERPLKVKIGGGESRGWSDYANKASITLSEEWAKYDFEFVMPERTDPKARFEFNMGQNDADIWLSDVRLEMVKEGPEITNPESEPRPALPGGNYIYNGTFDQGQDRFSYWEFRSDDTADATRYIGSGVTERRLETLINEGGDQVDSVQIVQPNVNLAQGNSYQLTFDASTDVSRDIEVKLVSSNGNVIANEIVTLDSDTNLYTVDFDVDVITDNDVELQFNLGGNDSNVYLDNVHIGRVLESDGIEGNLIRNGIFDSLTHWQTENNHSEAEFRVGEHFNVNITDPGTDTWAVQLYQTGVPVEQGETYDISFRARSTKDRPVLFQLENNTDYTTYFTENVEMTDSWETYTYRFTMDYETDLDTKFGFSFGGDGTDNIPSIEHDIFLDNIVLTKVEESEVPDEDDTEESGAGDSNTEDSNIKDSDTESSNIEDQDTEKPTEDKSDLEVTETEFTETEEEDESDLPDTGMATTNYVGIGLSVILLGIALALFNQKLSAKEK